MTPEEAEAAVRNGSRVRLRYVQGDTHAEGKIIGYSIVPTVFIVRDDGTQVSWRHDLAEVIPDPEDDGYECRCVKCTTGAVKSALDLMRSLSINPEIPDGFRIMMRESLEKAYPRETKG